MRRAAAGLALLAALGAAGAGRAQTPAPEPERIEVGTAGGPRAALVRRAAGEASGAPLLILLHDHRGDAARMRARTGFQEVAALDGWTLAWPEGLDGTWNAGRAMREGRPARDSDDLGFLRALADALAGPAGRGRVFVAGFGEGGALALRMICQAPGFADGVAVAMGTRAPSVSCGAGRPAPLLMFHGDADPAVPPVAGQRDPAHRVGIGAVLSPARTAETAAAVNGCLTVRDARPQARVRRRVWTGCREPLIHYLIRGGGHRWPGAEDQGRPGEDGLGPAVPAPDATRLISEFFLSLADRP